MSYHKLLPFLVLSVIVSMVTQTLNAQPVDSALTTLTIGQNVINNPTHLHQFFEKLHLLKNGQHEQVNIIHIGDSHIQADFLTDIVRKSLQNEFGNAGRGLIVPAKVAGTNEPLNFRTFSDSKWNAKRVIHTSKPLPIGIGGITVNTAEVGAKLSLRMTDPLVDYSFNTITLFYDEVVSSFDFSIQDSLAQELAHIAPRNSGAENFSRISLPAPYTNVSFQTVRQKEDQQQATVFGFSLENGNAGILYHAIGVNGAKYQHYNQAKLFARQTAFLKPDLIIISLGTNESVEYPYINRNFFSEVSKLVTSLSEHNPHAAFLLVTPPDAFMKKTKSNPGIEAIRMQIIQYAVENGLAFWDMYKVNGGPSSAIEWKMRGLLRPDGIHFSKEGYLHQGTLLYNAIMRGYNQYVSDRHP